MSAADDDVECVGSKGVDAMRDMPHSRFDCLQCPFPMDLASRTADKCRVACQKCYCWVCDAPWQACPTWAQHCIADGSPEWAVKRQKHQAKKYAKPATVPAADVAERFRAAAAAEDGSAATASDAEAARQEAQEGRAEDEENEDLFAEYEPRHLVGGQAHPDPIVETTSLAFAELPPITHDFSRPLDRIKEPQSASNPYGGSLSKAQLETVAYAGQRFSLRLASGERAGFFLGDGVGLGKGRQLAGIVLDCWSRGVKRHVWVSVSADLCVDAERDLKDICGGLPIINVTKLPYGKIASVRSADHPKGFKEGIIFSTYSALLGTSQGKRRLDMIIDWLGKGSADGCILFDEAHKAKNLHLDADEKAANKAADLASAQAAGRLLPDGSAGRAPKAKSTKMAQAVQELQAACPSARVVYCSATGASSLGNMAYMSRLGLWGAATAFRDFSEFEKAIGNGGVGAMELVALDMKRRGMYISRQLSFKSACYETQVIDLTTRQTEMYDAAARFWSDMHGCIVTALDILKVKASKGHPARRIMTHYWGCHQRFFRQMCMAIKVPSVVARAKEALAEGKCVVIGLQTTGESRLADAVRSGADLEEFAGMAEVIKFLLGKFPTGDYRQLHPEDDLSDNEEEDEELFDEARGRREKASKRRRRLAGSDDEMRSEDDEMDEDLRAFIADDDEDPEEASSSEDDADEDGADEGLDEGRGSRGTRASKLPAEVKALTRVQMRRVLDMAKVDSKNAYHEKALLQLLKAVLVERGATELRELMVKAGVAKRARDEGAGAPSAGASGTADAGPISRRKLSRTAAVAARSRYIEIDLCDEPEALDDVDEEASCAASDSTSKGGLLGQTLEVRLGGSKEWSTVTVVATGRGGKHHVELADGTKQWADLTNSSVWRYHHTRAAPGAAGARRVSVVLDDSDEDFAPSRPSSRAAGKRRASASPDSDESDDDDEPRRKSAPKASAPKASAPKASAPARKARKAAAPSDDEDEALDDGDDESDEAAYQHHSAVEIKQLQRLKLAMLKKLRKLRMPDNPLDTLIHELGGPDQVAEMTGRKGRLVRDASGKTVYAKRNDGAYGSDERKVNMEKINVHERAQFQAGVKRVAIISEAASSGISLQADRRCASSKLRRVHITLELPWSADQTIQQCGRTHRSNQTTGPEYMLMMTACGGERRFASTVAKKLQQLGALTKADRRAADAADLSAFDVDTRWGRMAMNELCEVLLNPAFNAQQPPPKYVREGLGFSLNAELQAKWTEYLDTASDALIETGITDAFNANTLKITMFLNRLLGLPVGVQNYIFSHFSAELDHQIKIAKQTDKFDEGVVDIRGEAIAVANGYPVTLATDAGTKVALTLHKLDIDRGISHARAMEILRDKAAQNPAHENFQAEGFYRSRRPVIGREKEDVRSTAILIQKPIRAFALNPVPIYKVYRPTTGLGADTSLREFTLDGRYVKVEPEQANKAWTQLYNDSLRYCLHGPKCKNPNCTVGKRMQNTYIISGAVLPYWAAIQKVVGYRTVQSSDRAQVKTFSRMSIARVRCNGGDGKEIRVVGIKIETSYELDKLKQELATIAADAAAATGAAASSSSDVKPQVKAEVKPRVLPSFNGAAPHGNAAAAPAGTPSVLSSTTKRTPSSGMPVRPNIEKGTPVTIQNLKSEGASKYNGMAGITGDYDSSMGRYTVALFSAECAGKLLYVKPECIKVRKSVDSV